MGNYVIIVEGRTDSALIESILETCFSCKSCESTNEVPKIFQDLIGRYPSPKKINGEQVSLRPNGFPMFYHNEYNSIVIKISNGNNKMAREINDTLEVIMAKLEDEEFDGFIVITDKDKYTEQDIKISFQKKLEKKLLTWNINNNQLENERNEKTKLYLYAIPQDTKGAIEKLLLNCVEKIDEYHNLNRMAKDFRDKLETGESFEKIRSNCWCKNEAIQSFYADKVQLGFISAVLKPDKPIGMTIKDKLIRPEYLPKLKQVDEFNKLCNFLKNLFDVKK